MRRPIDRCAGWEKFFVEWREKAETRTWLGQLARSGCRWLRRCTACMGGLRPRPRAPCERAASPCAWRRACSAGRRGAWMQRLWRIAQLRCGLKRSASSPAPGERADRGRRPCLARLSLQAQLFLVWPCWRLSPQPCRAPPFSPRPPWRWSAGAFGHARLLNPVPWNQGFSKTAPCGGGKKLPPSATWVVGEEPVIKWDLIAGDGDGASSAPHRLATRSHC